LIADAFDHSLDKPETLVKLYANLGRIRLVSSDAVLAAAEECRDRIVKLFAEPNRTVDQLVTTLHDGELEVFKHFSDACRVALRKYSAY
jgi:predicted translin family RNA/ssDNA-binding protein